MKLKKGVFPHWDIIPTVRFSFYVSQTETVCVLMFIRTETVSVTRCFGNQQRGKIRVIKGDGSDGPQKWNELCLVLVCLVLLTLSSGQWIGFTGSLVIQGVVLNWSSRQLSSTWNPGSRFWFDSIRQETLTYPNKEIFSFPI